MKGDKCKNYVLDNFDSTPPTPEIKDCHCDSQFTSSSSFHSEIASPSLFVVEIFFEGGGMKLKIDLPYTLPFKFLQAYLYTRYPYY